MATGSGDTKTENIGHWYPKAFGFRQLFRHSLFGYNRSYIAFANSKLRFIYSAKSAELIGDFCDAAIFRFLRFVTSL